MNKHRADVYASRAVVVLLLSLAGFVALHLWLLHLTGHLGK